MTKRIILTIFFSTTLLSAISQGNVDELIEKLTSRPATEILKELYELKVRERDGEKIEQPLITLFLGGNRFPVRGFLMDMKDETDKQSVVIRLQDANDVVFVD